MLKKLKLYYKFKRDAERVFLQALRAENILELALLHKWGYDFTKAITQEIHVSGMLPIHYCAQFQLKHSLDFLISAGIDINQSDINGKNTLMFTLLFSRNKPLDFLYYVLSKPLDVAHRDASGSSALFYIFRSQDPLAVMERLLILGARVDDPGYSFINYLTKHLKDPRPDTRSAYIRALSALPEIELHHTKTPDIETNAKALALYEHQELQKLANTPKTTKLFKL